MEQKKKTVKAEQTETSFREALKEKFPESESERKLAVIVGASSGIGYETAIKLIGRNYRIVNISRTTCRLEQVANYLADVSEADDMEKGILEIGADEKELAYAKNYAIKQITKDMENFSFNTAVARLMELVNALFKYDNNQVKNVPLLKETSKDLLLLLAPFAPHFAEELWEQCGFRYSVFDQAFPVCDESALVRDETEYAIQINSKMKTKMMLSKDMSKEDIQHAVMQSDAIRPLLEGKVVKKVIIVPDRLVNLIV